MLFPINYFYEFLTHDIKVNASSLAENLQLLYRLKACRTFDLCKLNKNDVVVYLTAVDFIIRVVASLIWWL